MIPFFHLRKPFAGQLVARNLFPTIKIKYWTNVNEGVENCSLQVTKLLIDSRFLRCVKGWGAVAEEEEPPARQPSVLQPFTQPEVQSRTHTTPNSYSHTPNHILQLPFWIPNTCPISLKGHRGNFFTRNGILGLYRGVWNKSEKDEKSWSSAPRARQPRRPESRQRPRTITNMAAIRWKLPAHMTPFMTSCNPCAYCKVPKAKGN